MVDLRLFQGFDWSAYHWWSLEPLVTMLLFFSLSCLYNVYRLFAKLGVSKRWAFKGLDRMDSQSVYNIDTSSIAKRDEGRHEGLGPSRLLL